MRDALATGLALYVLWGFTGPAAGQVGEPVCVPTPRPDPTNPALVFQREAFGFHDEELVLCSPGNERPTHIAARMFVPKNCEAPGSCPGVLISHGFGFTKETTIADMQTAASLGMVVLSYDVRGQGASGDQVGLMGREEIADQAAILEWFHENVQPTKVGVYGLSQGGAHAVMAAIFNCSPGRAAQFLDGNDTPDAPCGVDRWVDAIVPIQPPTTLAGDGTCSFFGLQAIPYSRFNLGITAEALRCPFRGTPLEDAIDAATSPFPAPDFSINEYIPLADRIDVPAYIVTSFFDRLVLPQTVTALYEALKDRGDDYGRDLRLIISNDSHGSVGGNFAVLNDVFAWLALELGASGAPSGFRDAPVAIAQEWQGNEFRLEEEWPIPGEIPLTFYLSRTSSEDEANGALRDQPPTGGEDQVADEMRNLPVVSTPPSLFFTDTVTQPVIAATSASGIPGARLVYVTEPMNETVEITGLPTVSLWVSSSGSLGQIHAALAEVSDEEGVTEFARNRVGLRNLGPVPQLVELPLTTSSHRIATGNRLMLTITPTDPAEALPFLTLDKTFVHHDAAYSSQVEIATVPVDRMPPEGDVPQGAGFPGDAFGAICDGLNLPCP